MAQSHLSECIQRQREHSLNISGKEKKALFPFKNSKLPERK
jgi:hypothetical protein